MHACAYVCVCVCMRVCVRSYMSVRPIKYDKCVGMVVRYLFVVVH